MAGGTKVGQAYVEITPKLGGNIGKLGDEIGSGIDPEGIGRKTGTGIKAGIGSIAIGTALGNVLLQGATAAVDGIKSVLAGAFSNFANYEQLVGGVDKLYGDASAQLQAYAENAYKTSGMSANQYMQQVTMFSSSLIGSLGGDTEKAAEMADMAMRAMSDNVNTFGSDAESVQNAIQGIARGEYSMLDNLRLGYAGNREGMQQLIDDANEYAKAQGLAGDLTMDSFADQLQAIQYVQEAQGIAGTTAKEAASTVQGSIDMVKASWQDFLTALGDPDADFDAKFGALTESLGNLANNAIPLIGRIFAGIGKAIPEAISYAINDLPAVLLPALQEAFASMGGEVGGFVGDMFATLGEIGTEIMEPLIEIFGTLGETVTGFVTENQPLLEQLGSAFLDVASVVGDILGTALDFVAQALGVVMPIVSNLASSLLPLLVGAMNAVQGVLTFVRESFEGLTNVLMVVISWLTPIYAAIAPALQQAFAMVGDALTTVGEFFTNVAQDAQESWQGLVDWIAGVPTAIVDFFRNLPGTIKARFEEARNFAVQAFNKMKETISRIPQAVVNFFQGIGGKIAEKFSDLASKVRGKFDQMVNRVKSIPGDIVEWFSGLGQKITNAIGSIRFPQPSVTWGSESKGGLSLPLPHVTWSARGRFLDAATLIGAGEAGTEAVIPLENRRYMQPFADAVADGIGMGEDGEYVVRWLARNLGPIINEYTPTMTRRELRREVAYA